MIEQLRMLSSPARYSAYVAGVILLFIVAMGVGATAAAIVGWQLERAATGDADTNQQAEPSTSEGSKLQATSTADLLRATGIKPSDNKNDRNDGADEKMFIHRATNKNSREDYTSITKPELDGDSNAVVLVSVGKERKDHGAASYTHNIGVWYTPVSHKWAIFNQDLAPVPAGSTFEVLVPDSSASFVHHAERSNSAKNYTYLDNRLTNGRPDVVLQVTQNWNPGGGGGVYNDHPVGVIYDSKLDEWAIYNQDGAPLPRGAAFNVAVSDGANQLSG